MHLMIRNILEVLSHCYRQERETEEVQNHGHKQKGLEIISRKTIKLTGKLYGRSC